MYGGVGERRGLIRKFAQLARNMRRVVKSQRRANTHAACDCLGLLDERTPISARQKNIMDKVNKMSSKQLKTLTRESLVTLEVD